ncbi:MAG: sulfatase [Terrimicrobiaceae bacterium]
MGLCLLFAAGSSVVGAAEAGDNQSAPPTRPNVLFIAVDDLRPEIAVFGEKGVATPNLDRLAGTGTRFTRAYCQFPVCGPSRASLMSGLRPTDTRFVIDRRQPSLESDAPGALTLNRHFRDNGYATAALGKIYHDRDDDLPGWSVPGWNAKMPHNHYALPENRAALKANGQYGPATECADVPDNAYPDGIIADEAVRRIEEAAAEGTPFFLAVGFWRPHLPFNAPKRYWDTYPEDSILLSENSDAPKGIPGIAMHNHPELRGYADIPKGDDPIPESLARRLVHGYRAAVSYSDAQVGRLLDALDRTGLGERTIVVLWGDHGWHLGDNGLWGKESLFERALRVPLIVSAPGLPGGQSSSALVDLVDLYPTLCELAGLSVPPHLEGESLAPLLSAPDRSWKNASVSCFIRPDRNKRGWSLRDNRYRYSEWTDAKGGGLERVLFDLQEDPQESRNLADDPAHAQTGADLAGKLVAERKKSAGSMSPSAAGPPGHQ